MDKIITTCDQSCQTISLCDKSTSTIKPIISKNKIIIKHYVENIMMRNYYKKRNQQTNILNLMVENESQREKAKKEIINKFNKNNDEIPKWLLGIKQ